MKYKNITNKPMFIKLGEGFRNVNPDEVIELEGREIEKKREGLVAIEESVVIEEEEFIKFIVDEAELLDMTKDQLNDYAAVVDIDVTTSMKKKEMIKVILEETNKRLEE